MKKKITGNLSGLKATQIKQIENLFHFKTSPEFLISEQQVCELTAISHDIKRQIGILIDRNGKTSHVIAGDSDRIVIPVTPDHMALPGRLKGLRCIHTHLKNEPLTFDDLTDLALLRLDYIAAVCINDNGTPAKIYSS
ncbi:MAG: GTPase HflX, partial [Desulfobacteraceae bacterium]|nr:GTPase HflX [Desulfobacteraceae bacterium]